MTTEKKTRTPRNAESILSGALKLPLAERVNLVQELKKSIANEVAEAEKLAEESKKIANGL